MPLNAKLIQKLSPPFARLTGISLTQLRAGFREACSLSTPVILFFAMTPALSTAQSTPPAQGPKGIQILLLGTSGGPPLHKDRSEPSTLLVVDGHKYLIDCGLGTMRRMVEAGIRSETIGTIFLTHLHPDHDLGLADVMANDYFIMGMAGTAHRVNIYGPPQTEELVNAAFNYIRIPFAVFAAERGTAPGRTANPFEVHEIEHAGLFYHDDTIRVIAAENTHYALMPAKSRSLMKSYSYRFETREGVVVFTGDTGPSDAVAQLAKGADVLVSETSGAKPDELSALVQKLAKENHWSSARSNDFMAHMTLEHLSLKEVGELASTAQVKSVVLYHYNPTDPAAYTAELKKYFPGPVYAPADLDRYCLNTQTQDITKAATVRPCH